MMNMMNMINMMKMINMMNMMYMITCVQYKISSTYTKCHSTVERYKGRFTGKARMRIVCLRPNNLNLKQPILTGTLTYTSKIFLSYFIITRS